MNLVAGFRYNVAKIMGPFMHSRYQTPAGSWTHRTTFFWATTGATVGLSNLWTFPHIVGENGGGAFLLVYLACLLFLTLPLMLTEAAIGRGARHGVVLALDVLARESGAPHRWVWPGRLSVVAGFLVLSFYAVIGGICLAYVFYAAYGRLDGAGDVQLTLVLTSLVQEPDHYRSFMGWHAFFLGLVMAASMQGVVNGLERALRVVMPLFVLLLFGLLVYGVRYGNIDAAMDYLLAMRPEQLSFNGVRQGLTHAFYTLALGVGVLVVFGAYSAPTTPLKRSVLAVALFDTLIAIVAGLVIYAAVFSHQGNATQGFNLVFLALPEALSALPFGQFVTTVFFVTIVLAAWSSSIALLEPAVSWLQERLTAPRGWSVLLIGLAAWTVGLASLLSFNAWSDDTFLGGSIYRWMEMLTSTLLIPVVSVLLAFFAGWAMPDDLAHRLIGRGPAFVRQVWQWVIRLLLPAVILYIGVHYAIQSGGSLCTSSSPPFWCEAHSDSEPASIIEPPPPPVSPEALPTESEPVDAPPESLQESVKEQKTQSSPEELLYQSA